jgi:hypothetical protein
VTVDTWQGAAGCGRVAKVNRSVTGRSPWRRLVILVTMACFAVVAALGPLGSFCLRLDGRGASLTVGACCCEPRGPSHDAAEQESARGDCCEHRRAPEPCGCVDLKGSDQIAVADKSADPLPAPTLVAPLPETVASRPFAPETVRPVPVRPPPDCTTIAPRSRILRC